MISMKDQFGGAVKFSQNCANASGDSILFRKEKLKNYLNETFKKTTKFVQVNEVLRQASETICKKLHNKEKIELAEEIESASKYTRRNAQYRTMAQNLIHHWTYVQVYDAEPPPKEIHMPKIRYFKRNELNKPVEYKTIPDEVKPFQKLINPKTYVNLTGSKATVCEYDDENKEIPFSVREYLCETFEVGWVMDNSKKSSYKEFHIESKNKTYDWTFEMTEFIEQCMDVYVEFAFKELCEYGQTFDEISAKIAYYNGELAKLKPGVNDGDVKHKANFEDLKRREQASLRQPSIQFKLYQGVLLELDQEELMNLWITKLENTNFEIKCESSIRLIRSLISDICNSTYGKAEAEFQDNIFNNLVKNVRYNEVMTDLRDNAIKVKYFKFQSDDCEGNDIDILPIKDFPKLAVNREVIECFKTNAPLTLSSKTFNEATILTAGIGGNVHIFDVLSLPNLNKAKLNTLCWSERLTKVSEWLTVADGNISNKFKVIRVSPVSLVEIQFDHIPVSLKVVDNREPLFIYYSTLGLGRGTKFVKVRSNGKTKNPTPNPRQKKSGFMPLINTKPSIVQRKFQYSNDLMRLSDYYKEITKANTIPEESVLHSITDDFEQPKKRRKKYDENIEDEEYFAMANVECVYEFSGDLNF